MASIAQGMGGFRAAMTAMLASPETAPLLTRERVSPVYFFSYTFIPLSSIAFPHIAIFCMTAKRLSHFRKTIVLYPICMIAIWLPSVFLGVVANRATNVPAVAAKLEARQALARPEAVGLSPAERGRLQTVAGGDDVILQLVDGYVPTVLAALLAAAVLAAVMASDSQILALSTMFTEDVFAYYGGLRRFGERVQVATGRAFVVGVTLIAYLLALTTPPSIFALATQYAFAGFAALTPLLVAALFWRGSTKWGALASTVWSGAAVLGVAVVQNAVPAPPPGQAVALVSIGGLDVVTRVSSGTMSLGLLPVVPITIISAILMVIVSTLTSSARPAGETLARYFPTDAARPPSTTARLRSPS
jgi:Na+/proline symporter